MMISTQWFPMKVYKTGKLCEFWSSSVMKWKWWGKFSLISVNYSYFSYLNQLVIIYFNLEFRNLVFGKGNNSFNLIQG